MIFDFSIIILVWNKEYEINLSLKAFTLQDYEKNKFEIIIIDDGSTNSLDKIIDKYKNEINIQYIRKKHTGNRAANRNFGVKKSRGERIIFIDGDMIPEKNIITEFDKYTKGNKKNCCLGVRNKLIEFDKGFINEEVIENNFIILKNLPSLKDERSYTLNFFSETGNSYEGNWQLFYSHSMCLWKTSFLEVNGFDEDFSKYWGAEDIELGYRLYLNGCKIIINENAISYHLHHPEDMLKKLDQLRLNYKIFVKKHTRWEIELFVKELELNPVNTILMQNSIKKCEYIINKIKNFDKIHKEIPKNTLLVGIEDQALIESDKVTTCFIPINTYKSDKIENIIGIDTIYENDFFNCALISGKYSKFNIGLFISLIKEINRVSKKIILIDEEKEHELNISYINNIISERNYVLFQLSGMLNGYTPYYFTKLALACDEIGLKTCIDLPWYCVNDLSICYLQSNDKEKNKRFNKLINHEYYMISHKIPNFLDAYFSIYNIFPKENRILWDDFNYRNQDKLLKNDIIGPYNYIFLRKKWEEKTLKNVNDITLDFLPVGIDVQKINNIKKDHKEKKRTFTFLWTDIFTNEYSNLNMLLETFYELFQDNKNVCLKIFASGNKISNINNIFFSSSFETFIKNNVIYKRYVYDSYYENLKNKYKDNENIIFQTNILYEEIYLEELYKADCLININSNLGIFPLILESIAFGKKPVTPYYLRYEDYFTKDLCFDIETEPYPAILYEGEVEQPGIDSHNYNRYFIAHKPKKESLKQKLEFIYQNQESILIDEKHVKKFIEKFDWINIAETLKMLLHKYF